MDTPEHSSGTTDRRNFLRCSACGIVGLAALSLPGCGDGPAPTDPTRGNPKDTTTVKTDTTTTTGSGEDKWEISGASIRIFLARNPELASVPGFLLVNPASTIVLRTAAESYSAFTAVCTHEGCFVASFENDRMVCPCHGSTFNLNGEVVIGPALQPLARFTTSLDATRNELLVTKTA